MRSKRVWIPVLCVAIAALASSRVGGRSGPLQERESPRGGRPSDGVTSMGEHQPRSWMMRHKAPNIPGVVAGGTDVQLVAVWEPSYGGEATISAPDGSLLFVQTDHHTVMKLDLESKITTYLETGKRVTGLAFDPKGRLVGVGSDNPSGENPKVEVWAPARSVLFEGKGVGRPNDLVMDTKGGAYISDLVSRVPFHVDGGGYSVPMPNQPGHKGAIRYLTPGGQLTTVTEAIPRPNGLQLSPDGKVFYTADYTGEFVTAFDVQPDGSLRNPRNHARIAEPGAASQANGMAVDAAGDLYVTSPLGVQVISPQGKNLGAILTGLKPANVAFAGPNKKSLFIISQGGALFRVAMLAEGLKNRAK